MPIYTSSRAEAHKREREQQKYTVGSSGTSATAQARDARRNAALAEMGVTTTNTAPRTTAAPKAATNNSGYTPTYGSGRLYTSAGNTAGSTVPKTTNVPKTTVAPKTTTAPKTGNTGTPRKTPNGTATIRSGMSDYDIQLRQDYNKKRNGQIAANQAKKDTYLQAMEEQTQADHNKRAQQLADEIDDLTVWSVPITQRATSENAHGSRQHSNYLQTQIDDARTKLNKLGGLYADEADIEPVEPQVRERKWYDTALDMANHAAGLTVTGVTGLVDGLANTVPTVEGILMGEEPEATFTGQLLKPITALTGKLNDWAVNETTSSAQRWQDDLADEPLSKQRAGNFAFSLMAAAPAAAAALLTKGGSLAGATTIGASGAPVLSGAGNVSLGSQVVDKVVKGMKNPGAILSGFRDFGAGKSEAMANGATETEASTAGLMEATKNFMIEQGGMGNLLPRPVEEGMKNVLQENTGGLIGKLTYDDDKKWFGWNNDNAVVDPVRDAGAFVSGALPSILSSGTKSIQQSYADTQAGEMIKAADKTTNLLQHALEAPSESVVYNMAKEMSERLEVALVETGMDAGDLYHMSREDQQNLITSVIDRTLTDREIGELSRMLTAFR